MKDFLKRFSFYREARYIWRSFVVYRRPFSYMWNRFVVGPRIQRLSRALDRQPETDTYSIHMLCGAKDILLFHWSLASWYESLPKGMAGKVYIHEDGSFTKREYELLGSYFPHAEVVQEKVAAEASIRGLSEYPRACAFRKSCSYIFWNKLVDPYFTGTAPYKLVLDSDLLWFKSPAELLEYVQEKKSCMTQGLDGRNMDYEFANGALLDHAIQQANSGVVGYSMHDFDFEMLEEFCKKNGDTITSRVTEQAAYAYLLQERLTFLDGEEYHIKGPVHTGTVMKHYTGPRREMFWYEGVERLKMKIL